MSEPTVRSLRRNAGWITGANVVRGLCQWGMLAALAKRGSPEMVGQYALGLAITAPVALLAGLQLNAVQATDAAGEFSFGDYLGLRGLTSVAAVAVVAAIVVAAGIGGPTASVVLLIAFAKAGDGTCDGFLSAWQQREEMRIVAAVWVVNAVCSLMLLTVGLMPTGGVCGAVRRWAA